jgi:hypothetical protein
MTKCMSFFFRLTGEQIRNFYLYKLINQIYECIQTRNSRFHQFLNFDNIQMFFIKTIKSCANFFFSLPLTIVDQIDIEIRSAYVSPTSTDEDRMSVKKPMG